MILLKKTKELTVRFCRIFWQFVFLHLNSIGSFFKNRYRELLFIFLLIFIFFLRLVTRLLVSWLLNINSFGLLYYLLFYSILFVVIYLYLVIIKEDTWLEKHQGIVITVGILIPIILFSWQQSLDDRDLFLNRTSLINEDNERNNRHLNSVMTDIKNDPSVLFWGIFYTENYKEYWSYISLNYSQECKNLYAELTLSFDGLNNMIKTRNDLLIKPGFIQMSVNKMNTEIVKAASNTNPILNEIISKCQRR